MEDFISDALLPLHHGHMIIKLIYADKFDVHIYPSIYKYLLHGMYFQLHLLWRYGQLNYVIYATLS